MIATFQEISDYLGPIFNSEKILYYIDDLNEGPYENGKYGIARVRIYSPGFERYLKLIADKFPKLYVYTRQAIPNSCFIGTRTQALRFFINVAAYDLDETRAYEEELGELGFEPHNKVFIELINDFVLSKVPKELK